MPLVTEIQRFCLQDGPGIRTTLFMKGCPLHCPWCHNPETQNRKREIYYYANLCTGCGRCVEVCPQEACVLKTGPDETALIEIDRDKCIACTSCVDACLNGAREAVGQLLTMDEILHECLSDEPFYKRSGGGVTLSGGDPLFFPDFSLALSKQLKQKGIHVAMETSCFPDFKVIRPLIGTIDLFIVDIKTMDPVKHRQTIGWPLEPILENIGKLIENDANVRIHLPIIPGFNDTAEDCRAYVNFLTPYADRLTGVDLLPFHAYGEGKYDFLGRTETYQYKGVEDKPSDQIKIFARALSMAGIARVSVGGMVGMGTEKGEKPKRREVVN
ncbi:glycyl-radical enzyme activating protein [Desulfosarcina ovata]|nr:glycyl-radical enzyme activating protein [Desulfosarcina ovata]